MDRFYRLRQTVGDQLKGLEIFEITPVLLGGNPNDPENRTFLNREQHIKAVVYWNRVIRETRDEIATNQRISGKRE